MDENIRSAKRINKSPKVVKYPVIECEIGKKVPQDDGADVEYKINKSNIEKKNKESAK